MNKIFIVFFIAFIVLSILMVYNDFLYRLDNFLNLLTKGLSCAEIKFPESVFYESLFNYTWTFQDFQDVYFNPERSDGFYGERFVSINSINDNLDEQYPVYPVWRLIIYPNQPSGGIGMALAPFQTKY